MKLACYMRDILAWCGLALLWITGIDEAPHHWRGYLMMACAIALFATLVRDTQAAKSFWTWVQGSRQK